MPEAQGGAPSYINYNTYDLADTIPRSAGSDVSPDVSNTSGNGCGCDRAGGYCTGTSPLTDGSAFSSVNQLIQYYQNTNPTYVELQKVQLQRYAALFASGETYSRGAVNMNVAGVVPDTGGAGL